MKKYYLLAVDDELAILNSLAQILDRKFPDLSVYTAGGALEALELIHDLECQNWLPAVVISDLAMPVITGDEFLHQIHDRFPETKTILLTGRVEVSSLTKAINQGGLYRYVAKPWELQDFLLTIQEALKSYLQERMLEARNRELLDLNTTLERRVGERTAELQSEIQQRKVAENEVKALNENLYIRINELSLVNRLIRKLGACRDYSETRDLLEVELSSFYPGIGLILGLVDAQFNEVELLNKGMVSHKILPLKGQSFLLDALEKRTTSVSKNDDCTPEFPLPGLSVVPFCAENRVLGCLLIDLGGKPPRTEDVVFFETLGVILGGAADIIQSLAREKEARLMAEEASKTKGRFLANMSHEIRTPMNAVLGFTQVLLNSENMNDENLEILRIVQSSGHHLLTLINDVLDLSKIEAGKLLLMLKPFNLRSLLFGVQRLLELQVKKKDLLFSINIDEEVPQLVLGDEAKLRQVLINLLNNSLTHTVQGEVRIDIHPGDVLEQVSFTVTDTGEGIDPEDLENIFEPFITAEKNNNSGGTGLGLAITQQLVNAMGGSLTLRSEPNKGTVVIFDVKLPTFLGDTPKLEDKYTQVTGAVQENSLKKILVVDDSEQNLRLMKELFHRVGCEVTTSTSGEESVKIGKNWIPDLVVMDMKMPKMDGLETTRNLRSLPGFEKVPFIGTSASWSPNETHDSFDRFLYKPFMEAELFKMVEDLLGLKLVFRTQILEKPNLLTPKALKVLPLQWRVNLAKDLANGALVEAQASLELWDPVWEPFKRAIIVMMDNNEGQRLKQLLEKSI